MMVMAFHPEEIALWREIRANPHDLRWRGNYAAWLKDRDKDSLLAQYIIYSITNYDVPGNYARSGEKKWEDYWNANSNEWVSDWNGRDDWTGAGIPGTGVPEVEFVDHWSRADEILEENKKAFKAAFGLKFYKGPITYRNGLPYRLNAEDVLLLSPENQEALKIPLRLLPITMRVDIENPQQREIVRDFAPVLFGMTLYKYPDFQHFPWMVNKLLSSINTSWTETTILWHRPQDLSALQELDLSETEASSLRHLPPDLSALQELNLSKMPIANLKGLPKELPALEVLNLRGAHITSLKGLPKEMPALRSLNLGCPYLSSLEHLPEKLPELRTMTLDHIRACNLKGLPREMSKLKELRLPQALLPELEKLIREGCFPALAEVNGKPISRFASLSEARSATGRGQAL